MPRSSCIFLAAALLASTPLMLLQSGASELHPGGKKKAVHESKRPQTGTFGISNSLNAPSTDFSHVTPDTGDAPEPRDHGGPVVRPSVDDNGHPVMGLGF